MKVKSVFCQPSKAYKARLGEGPEAFNAINMWVFIGKFIVAMLHPEVLHLIEKIKSDDVTYSAEEPLAECPW